MKIRNGFVSNSSSSSFTCDICGATESGYDMSLSEAGMYECENGHEFCESHLVNLSQEKLIEILDAQKLEVYEYNEDNKEDVTNYIEEELEPLIEDRELTLEAINNFLQEFDFEDLRYNLPKSFCPLCSFTDITDEDFVSYIIKTKGISKEGILTEIKDKFNNSYEDFKKFIEEDKHEN